MHLDQDDHPSVTFFLFYHVYFRVIQNIADSRPKVRYLIAKDESNSTLEDIVKVYYYQDVGSDLDQTSLTL